MRWQTKKCPRPRTENLILNLIFLGFPVLITFKLPSRTPHALLPLFCRLLRRNELVNSLFSLGNWPGEVILGSSLVFFSSFIRDFCPVPYTYSHAGWYLRDKQVLAS